MPGRTSGVSSVLSRVRGYPIAMGTAAALEVGVLALLLLYPFGLLAVVWWLGALERWMVTPSERAAEVSRLLAHEDADTIEHSVADLLASNADRPGAPVRSTRERGRRMVRRLHRPGASGGDRRRR